MKENTKFLTLIMTSLLHSQLKAMCAMNNFTMKQFCIDAIQEKMKAIQLKEKEL